MTKRRELIFLILFIVVCQVVGGIAGLFTAPKIGTWYATLVKPPFTPPDFVFAPAWIFLYAIMAIALFLVFRSRGDKTERRNAFIIFGIQLVLNGIWTVLFFGLESPGLAFAEIILLLVAIILTMFSFWKLSKVAALLLVPYLFWVGFASALNLSIAILNP